MSNNLGLVSVYRGTQFSILNPDKKDINILDIAHSLSNICRFNGHSRFFYSVAQHCLAVREMIRKDDLGAMMEMYGLTHDVSEFVCADLQSTFKACINGYREIEENIERVFYEAFDLPVPTDEERVIIKEYDKKALYVEAKNLMVGYRDMNNITNYGDLDYPIAKRDMEEVKVEYFWSFYTLLWEIQQSMLTYDEKHAK